MTALLVSKSFAHMHGFLFSLLLRAELYYTLDRLYQLIDVGSQFWGICEVPTTRPGNHPAGWVDCVA